MVNSPKILRRQSLPKLRRQFGSAQVLVVTKGTRGLGCRLEVALAGAIVGVGEGIDHGRIATLGGRREQPSKRIGRASRREAAGQRDLRKPGLGGRVGVAVRLAGRQTIIEDGLEPAEASEPRVGMAGFESAVPSAPGVAMAGFTAERYRHTVSRWMPSSRAMRRCDQPRA